MNSEKILLFGPVALVPLQVYFSLDTFVKPSLVFAKFSKVVAFSRVY